MTSSSEDITSSTESGPSTTTTPSSSPPSMLDGRYLAGADSDDSTHRSRSKSRRRSTASRKSSKKPSGSSKSKSQSKSRRPRSSRSRSSKSGSRKHSSKSSKAAKPSGSRRSSRSRKSSSRRSSSKSAARRSGRSRHGSRSRSRSQSRHSKRRSARRNQAEWAKRTQQSSLSCCSSFGIVVQAAILLLAFFFTVFCYYNAHSSMLYSLTVYTGVQGATWLVLMLSNCVMALHGAMFSFMTVTFVGFVELCLFMYFMISDSKASCDREGCTFMHGAFEHRFGAVALLIIAFLAHLVYSIVFICEAIAQYKKSQQLEAKHESSSKDKVIVAHVHRRSRSRKSRRSSSKSGKSEKPKKSRSSTKSKSQSKKPTKSKSKTSRRSSKRSVRTDATSVATSVPSTTSMVSYAPQQPPLATQPLLKLPSHSSVQSGYGHHCPVDAQHCAVTTCPYYRQNQELVRQLSSCHQGLGYGIQQRQVSQSQPIVRQEILPDQSRSIVIDLPQTQSQTIVQSNQGYVQSNQEYIRNSQTYGAGYGGDIDVQRVIVKIPPPPPQQQPPVQPQQSAIRDAEGNAYLTTITPVHKAGGR